MEIEIIRRMASLSKSSIIHFLIAFGRFLPGVEKDGFSPDKITLFSFKIRFSEDSEMPVASHTLLCTEDTLIGP